MQLARVILNGQLTLSPWFPRGSDNAIFSYQVIREIVGGDSMTVTVYHKNKDEAGRGEVHSSPTWLSDGPDNSVKYAQFDAVRELVRFAFAGAGTFGVVFRMLPPTWFDDAN
jgi:hypothetical protein